MSISTGVERLRPARMLSVVLVASLALVVAGCGSRSTDETDEGNSALTADCDVYQATQGITEDAIKVGASLPVTGPLAAAGSLRYGAEAYFDYVNDTQGGVDGRNLELIVRDDAYDPAKTATNVDELVNGEGVFAMLAVLGTANVLAVQADLQANCVPNLLAATGAPIVAAPENTWTVPGLPTYSVEADVLAQLAKAKNAKTVALLVQNDDFGKAYAEGAKAALEGSDVDIVKEITYESTAPNVSNEISQLVSTNADAVIVASVGTKCPQIVNGIAQSGWDPHILINSLCTSRSLLDLLDGSNGDGLITSQWYKSPGNPLWQDDQALQQYRDAMDDYQPKGNADEDFVLNGWLWAQLFVDILEGADELTRESVMDAARHADLHVDTMLDGIQFATNGSDDNEAITQLQAQQYDSGSHTFRFVDPDTGETLPDNTIKLANADK